MFLYHTLYARYHVVYHIPSTIYVVLRASDEELADDAPARARRARDENSHGGPWRPLEPWEPNSL